MIHACRFNVTAYCRGSRFYTIKVRCFWRGNFKIECYVCMCVIRRCRNYITFECLHVHIKKGKKTQIIEGDVGERVFPLNFIDCVVSCLINDKYNSYMTYLIESFSIIT